MKKLFNKFNSRSQVFLFCVLFPLAGFAQLTPTYIGSAVSTGGNCYTITTNTQSNSGAAWYGNAIDLSEDFDIVFNAFFGANPNGADGIAFVLKSTSTAEIGNIGEGLGYQNIPGQSLAIEFDTYSNTNQGDPSYDHIGVESGGSVTHNLVSPVQASSTSTNIKDNQQHEVKITWRAGTHTLKVYFDCVERINYSDQIIISVFGGYPTVYFGFTGSTGGSSNEQSVCFKYISFVASGFYDQIVCNGGSITDIDGTYVSAASYQWSPTTGVSDPTLPNPVFTPTETTTYTLTVTDNCGQTFERQFTATIDQVNVADPNDLTVCGDPAQTSFFDLHENDAVMKATLADPDQYDIEYYHSQQEIDDEYPMIYYDQNVGYEGYDGEVIYAKAVGFSTSCYVVKTFVLHINECNIDMEPHTAYVCEPAPYDEVENFDLTSYTDEMTVADPIPAEYVYTYYNNQADAEAPANPIANPSSYPGTNEVIWVRIDDTSATDSTVYNVAPLTLVINPQPEVGVYNDVASCDSYTLEPATTGNYYTAAGGTGTMLPAGTVITTSQTIYVYAVTGTVPNICTDETSFNITIFDSPQAQQMEDVEVCDSYTLPALSEGNYYTGPGGTGIQLFAGDIITATQTIYIYAVSGDSTTVCEDESDFVVTINYAPAVSPAAPLERCADNADEQTYFDLTVAGAEILNGQTGLTITYHETPEGAEFGTNEIQNPSNYDNLVSPVYASVIQSGTTTNCRSVVPIELIVHPRPAVPVLSDYVLCDDDTDGVQVFDLTTKNTEANGGDTSLTVAYYITKEDALAGQAPISPDTAFSNTVAGTQQIWVGIATTFGC
ncbi:L-type lectin-domain containing protein, partial [Flavobacterium sp. NRK1]|nr:L-type lectin-domain containing protein [Flavobacterium sp. NRK1]